MPYDHREAMTAIQAAERSRYHEAGHAVVACILGVRVARVTAATDEDLAAGRTGLVSYKPVDIVRARRSTVERQIRIALAGGCAERAFDPASAGGDEEDVVRASYWARLRLPGGALARLEAETEALVRGAWAAIEEVVAELEWGDGTVDGKTVRAAVRRAGLGRWQR